MPREDLPEDLPIEAIYEKLRRAIDEGNLEGITQIFKNHPALDWNAVTPNGLSALWWALTPPRDKTVNKKVIKLLLELSRKGQPVINPSQQYHNLRPDYYYEFYNEYSAEHQAWAYGVINDIKEAQRNYRSAVGAPAPLPVPLPVNELAVDAHGASNPLVLNASDDSLKRLYQHYPDVDADNEIKEIEAFLETLPFREAFPSIQTQQDQIRAGIERIKHNPDTRAGMQAGEGPINLKQALSLVWQASKETNLQWVEEENPLDRKIAILQAILEAQSAYGPNHPSCWAGTWGRLGTALCSRHKEVYYEKEAELTGELARNKYMALIGQALDNTLQQNRQTYWAIVRVALGLQEDAKHPDKHTYSEWLENILRPFLEKTLPFSNINKELIPGYLGELENNSLPLSSHRLSHSLITLQVLLSRYPNIFDNYLDNLLEEDPNNVITSLKNQYIDKMQPPTALINLVDEPVSIELKQYIVDTFLKEKSLNPDIQLDMIWKIAIFTKKIQNDKILNWYQRLPLAKQLLFEQEAQAIDMKAVMHFAIKHACINGLPLKELSLKNLDLRGWDLRGIDFSDVDLSDCDLRLIVFQHAKWERCNLRGARLNIYQFSDVLLGPTENLPDILMAHNMRGKPILHTFMLDYTDLEGYRHEPRVDILTNLIASQYCTFEALSAKDDQDCTALLRAIRLNNITIVNLILNSKNCRTELLLGGNGYDGQPLIEAINLDNDPDIALSIINSGYCTLDVLIKKNYQYETPLHRAIVRRGLPIIQAILNSHHCGRVLLVAKDRYGNTPLHAAVDTQNLPITEAILNSPHFSSEILEIKNKKGLTPLQLAEHPCNRHIHGDGIIQTLSTFKRHHAPLLAGGESVTQTSSDNPISNPTDGTQKTLAVESKETLASSANQSTKETPKHKLAFIKDLSKSLEDKTRAEILDLFAAIKNPTGDYHFIHEQKNPIWDKIRLFFKANSPQNKEQNFWHTATFQTAVKILKEAYIAKQTDTTDKDRQGEKDELIDYVRGNSPIHARKTSTRKSWKV